MMAEANNIIKQYDEFAEAYMKTQCKFYLKYPDKSRRALYTQIDFPLKDKRILDVGCGFGKDLIYFEKKGAIVYGIDASKKMIELAKKNNPSLVNLCLIRKVSPSRIWISMFR